MPTAKRAPLARDLLLPEEVARVIEAVRGDARQVARDQAILAVLWRGGLRVGELVALALSDFDAPNCRLSIRRSKTREGLRIAALDARACRLVTRWVALRGAREGALFCTRRGTPLWHTRIRRMLRDTAVRAGITKRVHPHGLRHAHAVELALEGVPLHEIRDQLGHASIQTTDHYLRRLSATGRLERIRAREW